MHYEVIIDAGETANKCTIAPLSYRQDFRLLRVKGESILGPLSSSLLLHHEGACLTDLRKTLNPIQGIASIDCTWRRLPILLGRVAGTLPVLARIPDGFQTAYPRRSKRNDDPSVGLATIEAIFIAAAMLGHWDLSLLSKYYFGIAFLKLNAQRFLELGVLEASHIENMPNPVLHARNSLQRRINQGRLPSSAHQI